MWDDERLDAAIDEAARQMTAGEPRADFRVRVMARIGGRASAMRVRRWALVAVPVAAAIVLAVVVLRERPRPQSIGSLEARLKPDATYAPVVAVPPSSTVPQVSRPVRLKPDPTYEAKPEAPLVRLPPRTQDATQVRLKPDATYDLELLTTAPLELDSIAVAALPPDDSIHPEPLPPAAPIAVRPLDVDIESE